MNQKQIQTIKTKYGPWALVTGASSGLGKALAHKLAQFGLNLVLSSRNKQELLVLENQLRASFGIETKVVVADLSLDQELMRLTSSIENLDIGLLVAAAGFGTSGYFMESSLEEEMNMLEVNCKAPLFLTHKFAQRFARQQRGGILLFSSIVAFQGVPYASHYAATKAYIQSLAEALHREFKAHGVDVLSAAPGPVHTKFAARANMRIGKALSPEEVAEPILRALGNKSTVYPGALTKMLTWSLQLLPRWGKTRVMQIVMGSMTRHQRKASFST